MKGNATGDLKRYFEALFQTASQGDAREESFYPALKTLLEQVAHSNGFHDLRVTILPTRTEGGNPDFRIWNGKDHIVGYVEAKKPTVEHLDQLEGSEQLQRYRTTFPNLILTNFFEFRLYRNGERIDSVLLGRPILFNQGLLPPVEKGEELIALLRRFFEFCLPQVNTAESLAVELAKRTRFLREGVRLRLQEEQEQGTGSLVGFYDAFKTYLIADLTPETFADLYAQTITYGLFAARTRTESGFSRRVAFDNIPPTIGILRDVFRYISFDDLPADIEWIVDDIAEVLAVTNVKEILDQYYRQHKGGDPIVHFYETFLKEYDPATRERRGVYYTPEPVVHYIVRSLHHLLQTQFHLQDGLASDGVTLLDPAAGTMTFVAHACQQAVQAFTQHYGTGGLSQFIREHILKNFYAFELMMAPYAIGHLKMAFLLEELGYRLNDDERFQLYLTNALEMEDLQQSRLPGLASLAQESHLAGEVKKQKPILVILGNPPYSVSSANKSSFIEREMEAYKTLVRNERNLMPLSDDYVKFLRFAQWKIEQRGEGIVGMITNHSYLDNPTFRGMRHSLMQTFDAIYLLNLHGNSLKRETAPDGSADENVFDIRQGVVIAFFIKHRATPPNGLAKVYYADLYGTREHKYEWLLHHDIRSTEWQTLHPTPAFYLFTPLNEAGREQYDQFVPIPDLFPAHSTGIKTHRDHFVIDFDAKTLTNRIRTFLDPTLPDEMARQAFELKDTDGWKLSEKRKLLQQDTDWEQKIVPCLYRPFDVRWIFYHQHMIERGRQEVMRHMLAGENLGLVTVRQVA
ncbi:MAG: type ISP restriction/modification enzyme, partial [Fimbriimonadales bacterium]